MKKISLAVLFCLFCSNFAFAGNADVSGWWFQQAGAYVSVVVHYENKTVWHWYGDNNIIYAHWDLSPVGGLFGSPSNVIQSSDGSISCVDTSVFGTVTLTGKVTGHTITFTRSAVNNLDGPNAEVANETCTGTITPGTIDCVCSGSYKYYTESFTDAWDEFVSGETTYSVPVEFYITPRNDSLDTIMDSGPSGNITQRNVTFTFHGISDESKITGYYYSFDSNDTVTYTTARTVNFNSLSLGTHTFSVVAHDEYGLEDSTPATVSFTIISEALDTIIDSGPSGNITQRDVTFTWHGTDGSGGIAGYYYQLDSLTKTYTTAASINFKNLSLGTHTFSVAAKDNESNIDSTPAVRSFTIEESPSPEPGLSPEPPIEKEFGIQPDKSTRDPINIVTGNMYVIAPDLVMPGRGLKFEFVRTYNSQEETEGPLGFGWTHSYNVYLEMDDGFGDANFVKIKDEQAKGYLFADNFDGTYIAQRGEYSTLTKNSTGFIWRKKDGKQYVFDLSGKLTQIKDRNNNAVSFSYNAGNNLTQIADTAGRVINLSYNSSNQLTRITDPAGRNYDYTYDSSGNLASVIDPKGNSTAYQYDSDHNLTKKTNPKGDSAYFTYDSSDRCTSSSGDGNYYYTGLTFYPEESMTTITDSKGNQTVHYYNSDNLITNVVNPQGGQILSTWDTNLNLTSRTDELGRTTSMVYDSMGNLILITDAFGNITLFTYELTFNQPTFSIDALGNITTYTYDKYGNLTKTVDALAGSVSYKYNIYGQPINATNQLRKKTLFGYDSQGNLSLKNDAAKGVTLFTYDGVGNLTQVKDAKNNITNFDYDELNQLSHVTYPDGSSVSNAYDEAGNRISVTDANANTTYYTYDQDHRVTSTTDASGHVINYVYDTEGDLISVTDQSNNRTSYEYDSLNRLISQTDALGNEVQYQYDAAGNRIASVDANGQTTAYEYDNLNRLTKIIYPDSEVSYAYDSLGRRISMTDAQGTTGYAYDKLGWLIRVDGPVANDNVSYTYDKAGNRLTLTDPDGKITKYKYDALNRLISVTDPQKKTTKYTFDALGNLVSLAYPNKINTVYTYDNMNRLTKLTQQQAKKPFTKLSEFSYTYDIRGLRTSVTTLDGEIDYTYDAKGELTEERKTSAAGSYQISYTYDPAGNRTQMIKDGLTHNYSHNVLNQLTNEQITGTEQIIYTYDKNGNMIKKQQGGETANLTYNPRNRLVQFTSPGVSETYEYDGEGKRISVENGSSTTNYLYDGLNVILERNAVGVTTANYVRNPNAAGGIGGIISEQSASQYYHYDGLGSVVNLTDSSGAIAQSYSYEAFGNIVTQTGSVNNRNKFLTKQADATGLVYFGARYYDPRIGRFITQDPTGMADGPNLYIYCLNNPVNFIDAWGLCKDPRSQTVGDLISDWLARERRQREIDRIYWDSRTNGAYSRMERMTDAILEALSNIYPSAFYVSQKDIDQYDKLKNDLDRLQLSIPITPLDPIDVFKEIRRINDPTMWGPP